MRPLRPHLLPLLLLSCALAHADTPTTRPATLKPVPQTVADLRALQDRVESVVARVAPTVVGIRVKGGQGSGVIVSDDGYVLTAGHVAVEPGRTVTLLLPDGNLVHATTLGVNHVADGALIKITEPHPGGGKWPFAPMGHSGRLTTGAWCVAMGHPGGYKPGRTPPLRLGRILETRGNALRSDCTLVGGDSGGPLFDLDGNVIGIHSRIGSTVNDNVHVPIDTFRDSWKRLANSEEWGESMFASRKPYLGVEEDENADDCRIGRVYPKSPAAEAGLKAGDVVTSFGGQNIEDFGDLIIQLATCKPKDVVNVAVLRDGKPLTLRVVIGRKPRD
jgi:serine protease Do